MMKLVEEVTIIRDYYKYYAVVGEKVMSATE